MKLEGVLVLVDLDETLIRAESFQRQRRYDFCVTVNNESYFDSSVSFCYFSILRVLREIVWF